MWDIGLNYWAILACAGAQAVIGALWYSKALFGKLWRVLVCKTENDLKKTNPAKAVAASFLGALVTSYVMALMIFSTGASSLVEGLQVGFLLWLGFLALPCLNNVFFAGQSVQLFSINRGFDLTVFLAMSATLTLWQ